MRVGIAGTGRMGTAMAERLIAEGHAVLAWNRTRENTVAVERAGATVAESPQALAADVDVVLTVLYDAAAIDAVYGALLDGVPAGRLFVDASTVRPGVAVALGERVRAAGAAFVECPVSGTTGPALEGQLLGFAGGEPVDVARAKPLLDVLCRRVDHVGPLGAGASLKLAINLPLAVSWVVYGEAMALCRHLGLSGDDLTTLFEESSGGTNALKARHQIVARTLEGERIRGTFDLPGMVKDIEAMVAEGEAKELGMGATRVALAAYRDAVAEGLGGYEPATLTDHISRAAR